MKRATVLAVLGTLFFVCGALQLYQARHTACYILEAKGWT